MDVKVFRVRKVFLTHVFAGFAVFHFVLKITIPNVRNLYSRLLLTSVFFLVNEIKFNRITIA